MIRNIRNKKIGLFVDNGVSKYMNQDTIELKDMIRIYLENHGFFVLIDNEFNLKGYLDLADLQNIKEIIEKMNGGDSNYKKDKLLSEMIKDELIKLRTETINSNEKLIDVLKKLDSSDQNYFPVIEGDTLLGRISRKIIEEKIGEIY